MPTHANALVLMARAPLAGKVKTRLVPPFSPEEAAGLYRCLLVDLLESVKSFRHADLFVAFSPAETAPLFQELVPPAFVLFPQRGGDLGDRMHNVFVDLASKAYKSIVLIGSDLPVFPSHFLEEAFAVLEKPGRDLVLGPSRDGGYYLIGMNRPIRQIFEDIPWGEEEVFIATAQRARRLGLSPSFLPQWFDIDRPEDMSYLASLAHQFAIHSQERTFAFLRELGSVRK